MEVSKLIVWQQMKTSLKSKVINKQHKEKKCSQNTEKKLEFQQIFEGQVQQI
jgi:hypothetical protein